MCVPGSRGAGGELVGMLLNLGGAHGPFFTRSLVLFTDSSGTTGVGEVPGGEGIRRTLDDACDLVAGRPIRRSDAILDAVRAAFGHLDARGRGPLTHDPGVAVHALTAIEAALLHLMGRLLDVPVAALLGDGVQRRTVPVLGNLFSIGDRRKTGLPYEAPPDGADGWLRLRREETLTPDAIVRQAEAARERYGFADFKLKGAVFRGDEDADAVRSLAERLPGVRINLDPNGAWSVRPPRQCTGGRPRLRRRSVRRRARLLRARDDGGAPPRHRHKHDRR